MPLEALQKECTRKVDVLLNEERCPLSGPEKQQLIRELIDEIFGLGPVEEFLRDPLVTDILVNGPHQIYVERAGRLELLEGHRLYRRTIVADGVVWERLRLGDFARIEDARAALRALRASYPDAWIDRADG